MHHPFAGQESIDLLEARAAEDGGRTSLVWQPFDGPAQSWSRAALLDAVRQAAAGLAARGVRAGDRVLLHAENCPEFLVAWFACSWLGAVCVVTNPRSAGPELRHFAEHTQAVGAVVQASLAPLVAEHCPGLRWLIPIGDEDAGSRPAGSSSRRASFGAPAGAPPPRTARDPFAPGSMMFTSGTSSRPKAVVWSRGNALWAARNGALTMGLRADDVALVFLPLYHVVGLAWSVLPALWAGAAIVLQPRFSASRFWDVAVAHRASFTAHVQFSTNVLSRQPVPAEHAFRIWGNSTWLPQYESHFRVPIHGWWGMTEMVAPGIVGDRALPQTAGSIGRTAPGYEIRIVDERDRPVPPGADGELLVRGQRGVSIFSGYYEDPQATEEAFTADGWFRTGDRMRLHPDGSIQFVERSRDVIKTGGEGVSAAEVERVIRGVEGVADASVVGRPDPRYGEAGIAFVVPDAAAVDGLAERILARCRAELASFKLPREIRLLPELPRAGLNKVAKGELRRLALKDEPEAARGPSYRT